MTPPNQRELELAKKTMGQYRRKDLEGGSDYFYARNFEHLSGALAHLLADYRATLLGEVRECVDKIPFPHGGYENPNFDDTKEMALAAIDSFALAGDKKE